MATMHPAVAAATGVPIRRFLAERMRIQQRCFAVLAHQIGNAASPISLLADVLELDSEFARREAAIGTLRRVAVMLSQLVTLTRGLRGPQLASQLAPRGIDDLAQWWLLFRPFAESMLPDAVQLQGLLQSSPMSPGTVDALTWIIPACIGHLHADRPTARVLTIALRSGGGAGTLQLQLAATGSAAVPAERAFRWLALARSVAREAGGDVTASRTPTSLRLAVRIPLPHT